MKAVGIVILFFFALASNAQEAYEVIAGDTIYKNVEILPEFPDGEQALMKYLVSIRWPEEIVDNDIFGKVIIEFTIDATGKVKNVKVAKSSGSEIFDKVVIEHIKQTPDWKPGYVSQKPVATRYFVPVSRN